MIGEDGLLVLLQRVVQLQVKEKLQKQELGLELGLTEFDLVLVQHVQYNNRKHAVTIVL